MTRALDLMTCAGCGKLARVHPCGRCHDCRALRMGRAKRARLRDARRLAALAAQERRLMDAAEVEADRLPDSSDPPDPPEF